MDKFKLIELYKIKSRLDTSEDGDLLSEVNEAIKRKKCFIRNISNRRTS